MEDPPGVITTHQKLILAGLIGVITGIISVYLAYLGSGDAGDFRYCLVPARDWLSGKDPFLPYILNLDPLAVPYPFTAVILAIPVAWLPDRIAGGLFTGLGNGILAWYILRNCKPWQLLIFLSWPLVNSVMFTQWSPYIVSMFFTPGLLLMVLIKPQIALPFALLQKPSRKGLLLAGALLLLSLALYPEWPIDWLKTTRNFIGSPPLLVLPLGPLLLLALLRYRDKSAWLVVLSAAMPQRMVYDQLGLLLVAGSRRQMIFLVLCSWISLPVILYYGGWEHVPWGWQQWVLIGSYLPALFVVLWPTLWERIARSRV